MIEKPRIPYEKTNNVMSSVTIEMDLNVEHFERQVYTIFDMASDVGGLSGILVSFFLMLSSLWNFNSFDNMMVSNLFVVS